MCRDIINQIFQQSLKGITAFSVCSVCMLNRNINNTVRTPDKCSSVGLLSGKIFYTGHICAGLDFADAGYAGVFWTDFVIDRNYGNLFNEHS